MLKVNYPFIYKQYDQQALNHQYTNSLNAPGYEYHLQQWEIVSKHAGEKYPHHKNIPYGEGKRETLDIFPSAGPGAKTLVFIHGGYWYKHNPSDFYLIAEAFHKYGITIVLIGYPLMPDDPMDQLVLSCRKAMDWVYRSIAQYNGNPEQIYVAGHSAGGHLASMMMVTNWTQFDERLPEELIKGVCAISGLYNLLPIQLSHVNENLGMDREMALRNSPVQLLPETHCPLLLAVGGEESAEYKAQTQELFDVWSVKGVDVQTAEIAGTNHFSILTSILEQNLPLHKMLCKLMGI